MITASEARGNVTEYEQAEYIRISTKLSEVIDTMSKSIEFHSKNGITQLTFYPYDKSRFSSFHDLIIASDILEKKFKNNGYKIIHNNHNNNVFTIRW